jgi:hypothetical protein
MLVFVGDVLKPIAGGELVSAGHTNLSSMTVILNSYAAIRKSAG